MDDTGAETTPAGIIHNIIGGIVAFAAIVMPLLMGLGFRGGAGGLKNEQKNTLAARFLYWGLVKLYGFVRKAVGFSVFAREYSV